VNERIKAIREAGEQKDRTAVPILVNRLEDEDDAVRFFAIIALERITGQRFGYEYSQPLAVRTRSVEIWREYLKSPDRALSMEREGHTGRGVTNATSHQGL
jgi:HEAT repeat protein